MNTIECFKIRIIERLGFDQWDIDSSKVLHEILCDGTSFNINPIIICADPFLFVDANTLFLFYEEKRLRTPGILRMICTTDLKKWSKPVTVLEEPFHLSYPCVFEDNGIVYMIPETCAAGEVRLYKADNKELTSFSQECVLLRHEVHDSHIDIDYSDSSIYKHKDDKYYLMTTLCIDGVNKLQLYVADVLKGPYSEHPLSPVCKSQKYGRNGGCMFEKDGHIYRVAQDCEKRYGDNVHLFEVTELSEREYSETLIKENLLNTSIPFYAEGGHQFNMVDFNGKTIVATDAKEYQLYLFNRIIGKLKNII